MRKKDLKNRMVVENRRGDRGMIIDGHVMFEHSTILLKEAYNEDLCFLGGKNHDIVKVFDRVEHFKDAFNINKEPIWERPREFTKDDLKNGMIVETRGGERYMVIGIFAINSIRTITFFSYDNNLVNENHEPDMDIVKVFEPNFNVIENAITKTGKCLWDKGDK